MVYLGFSILVAIFIWLIQVVPILLIIMLTQKLWANASKRHKVVTMIIAILLFTIPLTIAYHYASYERDAEVALGLDSLPDSTDNLHIHVDAWADYVVMGYFEINSDDFSKVISGRNYTHNKCDYPTSSGKVNDNSPEFNATDRYWCEGSGHNCYILTNETRNKIYFSYATGW